MVGLAGRLQREGLEPGCQGDRTPGKGHRDSEVTVGGGRFGCNDAEGATLTLWLAGRNVSASSAESDDPRPQFYPGLEMDINLNSCLTPTSSGQ